MSDTQRPSMEEMARQAKQHLASLRAAGVEWLPAPPCPPLFRMSNRLKNRRVPRLLLLSSPIPRRHLLIP